MIVGLLFYKQGQFWFLGQILKDRKISRWLSLVLLHRQEFTSITLNPDTRCFTMVALLRWFLKPQKTWVGNECIVLSYRPDRCHNPCRHGTSYWRQKDAFWKNKIFLTSMWCTMPAGETPVPWLTSAVFLTTVITESYQVKIVLSPMEIVRKVAMLFICTCHEMFQSAKVAILSRNYRS